MQSRQQSLAIVLLLLLSLSLFFLGPEDQSAAPSALSSDADEGEGEQEGSLLLAGEGSSTLHTPPPHSIDGEERIESVDSVCDLPEFAVGAPRPKIAIFVFAWRRLASLRRLVDSLLAAEYCGHTMPLTIMVDGGALAAVREYVRGVEWRHGPLRLVVADDGPAPVASLGIRGMWINCSSLASAGELRDDEHILPLEDDIEVSPLFYWWLLRAARSYGPIGDGTLMRRRRLVGISLYTPRLNEIHYPQVKWLPEVHERAPAFLLQFYALRVRPPFFDFAQEAAQRGVGKHREPLGERAARHGARALLCSRDPHVRLPASRSNATSLRRDTDPLKTVPLVLASQTNAVQRAMAELPSFARLGVFDLQHERRSAERLVQAGFAFTESVRWWGHHRAAAEGNPALLPAYAALADLWAGLPSPADPAVGSCAIEVLPALVPRSIAHSLEALQPANLNLANLNLAASSAPPSSTPLAPFSGRYVVFQPPSGLGEYFVALRNAAGIAAALHRTLVVDDFLQLRLAPDCLLFLHVKDPHLLPSRAYFDAVAGWSNLSAIHMPSQMCAAADYRRLYGGCGAPVLAFSHLYAAFEGFPPGSPLAAWFADELPAALSTSDSEEATRKAGRIIARLAAETGSFSCIHLSHLDAAVVSSRAPLTPTPDSASFGDAHEADTSAPHADSGGAPNTLRLPSTACDAFDAESHQPAGRAWVKELSSAGYSCHVSEAVLRANLARLPPRDPILILADGGRALPERLAERASNELRSEFRHVGDVVALLGLDIRLPEWPSVELAACAAASTLLLNRYSPLSALLERRASRRAVAFAESADGSAAAPRSLWWMRVGSDRCVPLFTRTCRFDLQPNRFGILGQFGPERKLQLQTYNVSSLIGWDGRVTPNASIELEVYVSNESHALATFEYTKDNNKLGLTFQQQRGDYVRIRNVYLRSSTQAPSSETARTHRSQPLSSTEARVALGLGARQIMELAGGSKAKGDEDV
ncbi:hypothetical protein EMIHUDRAFT_456961 [Emiliania huxleyi CCMP1516]|uniref:Uncharacterized protein n=2 Tax=Emiliania huxleyi TaxID=2903 RepID=A0A0D3JYT3_EMIH1|nr:hypothetical protein EMIHUDRAFT_456961 [Emiliania huxleyi CCMP1516]EOD28668.1 hypothetical protein EMIHUDRAFT_456961 [Emiliania huxleyi CCMP1516]|eukprot:XP_005781097.1 hypothetical protein EMIHUDRAFT_456961 [Emiliania huxleyi CCMP1516]